MTLRRNPNEPKNAVKIEGLNDIASVPAAGPVIRVLVAVESARKARASRGGIGAASPDWGPRRDGWERVRRLWRSHIPYAGMVDWYCPRCEVAGRDPGPQPRCWCCGDAVPLPPATVTFPPAAVVQWAPPKGRFRRAKRNMAEQ